MLTTMRQSIRSLQSILWLVIAAFVVTIFYAWGKGGAANNPAGILAWVDGEEILYRDYNHELQNLALSLQQAAGGEQLDPETIERLGLRQRALDSLIQRRILAHAAASIGVEVSDAELSDAIRAIPTFQEGGLFRKDYYDAFLRNRRLTADVFEANQRELIQAFHLAQLVGGALTVTDAEIADAYRLQGESLKVEYCLLTPERLRGRVEVSEEDLTAYHAAHPERYQAAEEARIAYLTFRPADFEEGITPTDDELRDEYENHLEDFEAQETVRARHILLRVADDADDATVAAVQARANELYDKAVGGADFAELARAESEDTTASVGGDLGEFTRGQMVPEFEEAAFSTPVGEVYGPLRTSFGFHVIKVEDHQPGGLKPQEEVIDILRQRVVHRQSKTVCLAQATSAQGQLADGVDPDQVATDVGLTWQEAGPFTVAAAPLPRPLVEALFETPAGQVGRPVEAGELFYVFRSLERIPARPQTLEEARDQVEAHLRQERASELAREVAVAWKTAVEQGEKLEQLAAEYDLSVDLPAPFTRATPPPALATYGDLRSLFRSGSGDVTTLDGVSGVAVVHILEKVAPDAAALEGARDGIEQQLLAAKRQLAMTVLLNNLREKAKVRLNEPVLVQVLGRAAAAS